MAVINAVTNFDLIDTETVCTDKMLWVSDKVTEEQLDKIKSPLGLIICSKVIFEKLPIKPMVALLVTSPRNGFLKIMEAKFKAPKKIGIELTAQIAKSAAIGERCYIGQNVVIEDNVAIGNDVSIHHNSVILTGTIIKNNVTIGANCTIGGAGFGYEKSEEGDYHQLPHIGNVVIEDFVTIHNNTCIDRALIGSTIIGRNAKIDNQVHIAHGVKIGENTLVIAHAMIAGSTKVGKNVWIAPSAAVRNKLTINDGSTVGMSAVVVKDVANEDIVAGNPAKSIRPKQ